MLSEARASGSPGGGQRARRSGGRTAPGPARSRLALAWERVRPFCVALWRFAVLSGPPACQDLGCQRTAAQRPAREAGVWFYRHTATPPPRNKRTLGSSQSAECWGTGGRREGSRLPTSVLLACWRRDALSDRCGERREQKSRPGCPGFGPCPPPGVPTGLSGPAHGGAF